MKKALGALGSVSRGLREDVVFVLTRILRNIRERRGEMAGAGGVSVTVTGMRGLGLGFALRRRVEEAGDMLWVRMAWERACEEVLRWCDVSE